MKNRPAINDLLEVMARLRSPKGCPWDREQDHMTLRWHANGMAFELQYSGFTINNVVPGGWTIAVEMSFYLLIIDLHFAYFT